MKEGFLLNNKGYSQYLLSALKVFLIKWLLTQVTTHMHNSVTHTHKQKERLFEANLFFSHLMPRGTASMPH